MNLSKVNKRISNSFEPHSQTFVLPHSVSLELLEDGETPKPPKDSWEDGLPKLYIHHNGFMKVLGCTLDVDIDNMKPVLYDSEGLVKDPNV